jgi:iron complex transport system ATP-binding protein
MMLDVSKVHFRYNGRMVLQDISFCLHGGEFLAVVGVNGSGKTTLLKCLNGILEQAKGTILLDGVDTRRMNRIDRARRISYVPQRYSDAHITVFDAVLLGRKPYMAWSWSEEDLRVTETVLSMLHLEDMALRPVSSLSGGELQKVIIGRAFAQEPQLLILDEPTSNLDIKGQMEIMGILSEVVKGRNISLIVATHDINMAMRFADRILMLKDGRIHSMALRGEVTEELIRQVLGVDVIMGRVEHYDVVVPLPPGTPGG